MRKTQVALAAVALLASTAALADGVKVSGCVDATVVNTTSGTVLGGAGDGCASQIGFYGSSDAGGLKTGFNLETGFSTANGAITNGGNASTTGVFNRLANVYLGNDMATVKLGLQKSPWIEAAAGGLTAYGMNGVGVPALAVLNPNLSGTSQAGGFFVANGASVQFNAGGINGNVMTVINAASQASGSGTNDSYTAGRLSTNAGPVSLNLGYEVRKNTTPTTNTNDVDYNNTVVSGAYDVGGGIGLNAAWSRQSAGSAHGSTTNGGASQNAYILGASYKMSDTIGFGITYARNNRTTRASMTALSAQYNLSPATVLYANYIDYTNQDKTALNNAGNADGATTYGSAYTGSLIGVGLMHAF